MVGRGAWVQIEQVVMEPDERAPNLPEDTRGVPYVLRVSGFLIDDAAIGDAARVRTLIGRELGGTLTTINPGYAHSFGDTVAELLDIGIDRGARR
jgi:2-amino-4-ketopentanoate thiolase alpha subunit